MLKTLPYTLSIFFVFITALFGQAQIAPNPIYNPYGQDIDIRLMPKYGMREKSAAQKEFDQAFLKNIMSMEKYHNNQRLASDDLVDLGFKKISSRDMIKAMHTFNQAYLVDSTNSNVFWGYAVYYALQNQMELAKQQLSEGLLLDSNNVKILTDYGTIFMQEAIDLKGSDAEKEQELALQGLQYLLRSYQIDPKKELTLSRLMHCYYILNDCKSAWRYYDESVAVESSKVSPSLLAKLKEKCPRNEGE